MELIGPRNGVDLADGDDLAVVHVLLEFVGVEHLEAVGLLHWSPSSSPFPRIRGSPRTFFIKIKLVLYVKLTKFV